MAAAHCNTSIAPRVGCYSDNARGCGHPQAPPLPDTYYHGGVRLPPKLARNFFRRAPVVTRVTVTP